ncbi:MAG: hypothetical protein E3J87_10295 [Candidatus Cloacimonadota bacterium]|nr:MAG: hypothetical protein E3J87_10295 [Candidatus Cloacimonadota bacterium]
MIKFSFKSFETEHFGIVKRPFGTIKLISGNYSVRGEFLIDSGADITIVPKGFGETGLGFSLMEGEKVVNLGGVGGGSIPVVMRNIEIRIEDEVIETRIAWALADTVPLILGRLDFFKKFNIEFRESENNIILQKVIHLEP